MMEIASEMDEMKYESSMEITENTRTNIAVVLGKVFDNMYYDLARERFTSKIEEFIQFVKSISFLTISKYNLYFTKPVKSY